MARALSYGLMASQEIIQATFELTGALLRAGGWKNATHARLEFTGMQTLHTGLIAKAGFCGAVT